MHMRISTIARAVVSELILESELRGDAGIPSPEHTWLAAKIKSAAR